MIASIADTLDDLYETFDPAPEGEDLLLVWSEVFAEQHAGLATYWSEINAARVEEGSLAYDGLVIEASATALSEMDPNLRTDALLRLAAVALSYAASIQRQADAFNAEESKPSKVKGGE